MVFSVMRWPNVGPDALPRRRAGSGSGVKPVKVRPPACRERRTRARLVTAGAYTEPVLSTPIRSFPDLRSVSSRYPRPS